MGIRKGCQSISFLLSSTNRFIFQIWVLQEQFFDQLGVEIFFPSASVGFWSFRFEVRWVFDIVEDGTIEGIIWVDHTQFGIVFQSGNCVHSGPSTIIHDFNITKLDFV